MSFAISRPSKQATFMLRSTEKPSTNDDTKDERKDEKKYIGQAKVEERLSQVLPFAIPKKRNTRNLTYGSLRNTTIGRSFDIADEAKKNTDSDSELSDATIKPRRNINKEKIKDKE